MENIQKAFENEISQISKLFEESNEFLELRDFYKTMQEGGFAVKQEYVLRNSMGGPIANAPTKPSSWFGTYLAQNQASNL